MKTCRLKQNILKYHLLVKGRGGNFHLKRLNKRPEESSNAFSAAEKFDESHDTEEAEETDAHDRRTLRLEKRESGNY